MAGESVQSAESFTALYAQAQESEKLYTQQAEKFIAGLKERYPGKFDTVRFDHPPIKNYADALRKIETQYQGNFNRITDLVRGRFMIENAEQLEIIRTEMAAHQDTIVSSKDQFAEPTDTHFRAVNATMRLPNGHVVELRIEHEGMNRASKISHSLYREIQWIDAKAEAEGRGLTELETTERASLMAQVRNLHDDAAKKAGLESLLNDKGRHKLEAHAVTDAPFTKTTQTHVAHTTKDGPSAANEIPLRTEGNLAVQTAPVVQPVTELQPGQTSDIGAKHALAANEPHITPSRVSELHGPLPMKVTAGGALKGSAAMAGGLAMAAGVVEAGQVLYHGGSVTNAVTQGGAATINALPGVHATKQHRYAEATMELVSVTLVGTALAAAPVSLGTSLGIAAALDEGLRRGGKALGLDLDDATTTSIAKAMASAIEQTIPPTIMRSNVQFLSIQEGLLKDCGLGTKDANGLTAADYLRNPKTRDAFLHSLKESLSHATDPKAHEQLQMMVDIAEKVVDMEGRRVAKLEPYMHGIESKLADTLKVQQLAQAYKKDSNHQASVTDVTPGAPLPRVSFAPQGRT